MTRTITLLTRFEVDGDEDISAHLVRTVEDQIERAADEGFLTPDSCEETSVSTFNVDEIGDIRRHPDNAIKASVARAKMALAAFSEDASSTNDDELNVLRDLLADLMHMAVSEEVNFDNELLIAKDNFIDEINNGD